MRFSLVAFTLGFATQVFALPSDRKHGAKNPYQLKIDDKTDKVADQKPKAAETPTQNTGATASPLGLVVPGASPLDPLFVDIGTALSDNPLFPPGLFMNIRDLDILEIIVNNLITEQKGIQSAISPQRDGPFTQSIELWQKLLDTIPTPRVLREGLYVEAIQALEDALRTAKKDGICSKDPKVQPLLAAMLLDNMFLAGFMNSAFSNIAVPTYLLSGPGEVYGLLLNMLAIDVTKPLDLGL